MYFCSVLWFPALVSSSCSNFINFSSSFSFAHFGFGSLMPPDAWSLSRNSPARLNSVRAFVCASARSRLRLATLVLMPSRFSLAARARGSAATSSSWRASSCYGMTSARRSRRCKMDFANKAGVTPSNSSGVIQCPPTFQP